MQHQGFLACTLSQVAMLIPIKTLGGQALTMEETLANQALHHHRLPMVPINRSVKHYHIVKDRSRVRKEGVREVVMALCCALHHVRMRLTPDSRWLNRNTLPYPHAKP